MHKSKHVVNVLLVGMIFFAAMAAGGCGPRTLAGARQIKIAKCQKRPVNIEVALGQNNTEFHRDVNKLLVFAQIFTPFPFAKGSMTGSIYDTEYLNWLAAHEYKHSDYKETGRLTWSNDIMTSSPVMAAYLKQSGIADTIYLHGEVFTGDTGAFKYPEKELPEPDVVVRLVLNEYHGKGVNITYGMPLIVSWLSGCVLTGLHGTFEWSFDIVACNVATGDEIYRKNYSGSASKFIPLGAVWHKPYCSIVGSAIHDAYEDFVGGLDKALPPPTDVSYWSEIAAKRKIRVARYYRIPPK